jgi:hypothetical protein
MLQSELIIMLQSGLIILLQLPPKYLRFQHRLEDKPSQLHKPAQHDMGSGPMIVLQLPPKYPLTLQHRHEDTPSQLHEPAQHDMGSHSIILLQFLPKPYNHTAPVSSKPLQSYCSSIVQSPLLSCSNFLIATCRSFSHSCTR